MLCVVKIIFLMNNFNTIIQLDDMVKHYVTIFKEIFTVHDKMHQQYQILKKCYSDSLVE